MRISEESGTTEPPPRVSKAVMVAGQRVVLFSWGASAEPRLRNLAAVDRDGTTRWIAELPAGTGRDCFVKLETLGSQLFATTFSGLTLHLDPRTGANLASVGAARRDCESAR